MTVALVSLGGHVDRELQRIGKTLEAAAVLAGFRDLIKPALGVLDLLARRRVDRRIEGDVDDVFADVDQIAPDREVMNGAAVIMRVDDGRRFRDEAGEILRHGDARAEIMFA